MTTPTDYRAKAEEIAARLGQIPSKFNIETLLCLHGLLAQLAKAEAEVARLTARIAQADAFAARVLDGHE